MLQLMSCQIVARHSAPVGEAGKAREILKTDKNSSRRREWRSDKTGIRVKIGRTPIRFGVLNWGGRVASAVARCRNTPLMVTGRMPGPGSGEINKGLRT
jgi:hypothetical protein